MSYPDLDDDDMPKLVDNISELHKESFQAEEEHKGLNGDEKKFGLLGQIVWRNVLSITMIHVLGLYGLTFVPKAHVFTLVFAFLLHLLSGIGILVGAHRYWCHRTFQANSIFRVILFLCNTLALQDDIYTWCRDHRTHHKFSETSADPYNSRRGLFFSHVGWLMVRKHPDVIRRGSTLDFSDLLQDPIVRFQRTFYIPLVGICWLALPTLIPCYLWNEDVITSLLICVFLRYIYSLNVTWTVNSLAHAYGERPYDKRQAAAEVWHRNVLFGEGFHNYHHSFPWDYAASEHYATRVFNPGTLVIDFFYCLGCAWDLKRAQPSLIDRIKKATGSGETPYDNVSWLYEWFSGLFLSFLPLSFMLLLKFIVYLISLQEEHVP